jgi:hypothetical protein
VLVQSVSPVGHLGASEARSGGDHPEGVGWGYICLSGACQTEAQGGKAKEGQKEL